MLLYKKISDEKAAELGQQHFFDTIKHLTTLNTASILLLATLLEKFFSQPEWKFLIGLTFIFFIVSIITSLMLMFWHSSSSDEDLSGLSVHGIVTFAILIIVAIWSFILGMISLVIFAIKNFY